ncbi:MAG: hypothetical protein LJI21_01680 [Wolbachia endosymbiont of Menacanthus eurysternus]|nr:MAG: hypothetical protein LJI21_01680 [Wolbachia endosymbiont of Menacanthus eurysternus]
MRITQSKIQKFLERPNLLKGVLIYGNDNSKIDFFIQKITSVLYEYSIQIVDFVTINKSPDLLFSELENISMFYNKKLIKLINVSGSISKEFKYLLNHIMNDNNYLIMIANNLPYKSTIRSYIENLKSFGTIACYKDSSNDDLYHILSNYLEQNKIKCTNEIIYHLQSYFNHSKLSMYSELKKLVLYLGKRKNLKSSDIELCFPHIP